MMRFFLRWFIVLPLFVAAVLGLEWVVGRAAYSGVDVPPVVAIAALVLLSFLAALAILGKPSKGRAQPQTAIKWILAVAFFIVVGFVCSIRT
jgi:phosphoglycerol transferase MdoB-like AlkP superfamily enzyme